MKELENSDPQRVISMIPKNRASFAEEDLTGPQVRRKVMFSAIFAGILLLLIWLTFFFDRFFGLDLNRFGLRPRTLDGLLGILTSPFLHGGDGNPFSLKDFQHILSNSLPLFLLFTGAIYFYRGTAFKMLVMVWFVTGAGVWLIGRDSIHIGASGIVYGLAAFMALSGIIRNDTRLMSISFLTIFLYGGMVWGILPLKPAISWESHLFGSIGGIIAAVIFRKEGPVKKKYFEDEEVLDEPVPLSEDLNAPSPYEQQNPDFGNQQSTGNHPVYYYRYIPKQNKDGQSEPNA